MERVDIKVQWLRQYMQGGTPLEFWAAHLIEPWTSMEFAWVRRVKGVWTVVICHNGKDVLSAPPYQGRKPDQAMRHVLRWIHARDRWRKLVIAGQGSDPRTAKYEMLPGQPDSVTYAARMARHPLVGGHPGPGKVRRG